MASISLFLHFFVVFTAQRNLFSMLLSWIYVPKEEIRKLFVNWTVPILVCHMNPIEFVIASNQ